MARRTLAVLSAIAMAMCALVLVTPTGAAATPLPSADPFYSYSGNLSAKKPGQVLKRRPSRFVAAGLTVPVDTTQLLYRSVGNLGQPIAGVTTVLRPRGGGNNQVISYHMAYDALGSQCDPSYTLQGNMPTPISRVEQTLIGSYVARGYTVLVPDYEGLDEQWTIARQEGKLALDGIRAAESFLRLPSSTPVALLGYSGGSVPTEFAAEFAPTYAPELAIKVAAAGGLPVNLAHNLNYVSGSQKWAGVMPAVVEAYRRTYNLNVSKFLSARGMQLLADVRNLCIASFASKYPGLTNAQMVKPPYTSLLQVKVVRDLIAANVMGTLGRPRIPMFLGVGQINGSIGDGVMITADVRNLASKYCSQGVPVHFKRYAGDSHGQAFLPFEADADAFITARLAGRPVPGCNT